MFPVEHYFKSFRAFCSADVLGLLQSLGEDAYIADFLFWWCYYNLTLTIKFTGLSLVLITHDTLYQQILLASCLWSILIHSFICSFDTYMLGTDVHLPLSDDVTGWLKAPWRQMGQSWVLELVTASCVAPRKWRNLEPQLSFSVKWEYGHVPCGFTKGLKAVPLFMIGMTVVSQRALLAPSSLIQWSRGPVEKGGWGGPQPCRPLCIGNPSLVKGDVCIHPSAQQQLLCTWDTNGQSQTPHRLGL